LELAPVPFRPTMRPMISKANDAKTIGRRLHRMRVALGYENLSVFARALNCAPNRYNQYENGVRPLTLAVAIRICDKFGVTLDWLYRGDSSGLPKRLTDLGLAA
jgi:transcriptional regulator with XRE-family HTH domain